MAADLLRPSSSELKEQEMVSRRLEPQLNAHHSSAPQLNAHQSSGQEARVQEFLSFSEESATGHCELGNLQIACVAAIAQLQGRLEAMERTSQAQIEALKDQVIAAIMNDETSASRFTPRPNCEPLISKDFDSLSQRIDKMHDKAETSYAEMSRRILALELHNTSLEKRLFDKEQPAPLAAQSGQMPRRGLDDIFQTPGPSLNPGDLYQAQERFGVRQEQPARSSQPMGMDRAVSLDSQVTSAPLASQSSLITLIDNHASRSSGITETRSLVGSQVTTIGDTGSRSTATIIIQEAPAEVSSPTGDEHSCASYQTPDRASPVLQKSGAARIISPRAIQRAAGSGGSVVRVASPVQPSRCGLKSTKEGNPSMDDEGSGNRIITPAAAFRYPSPAQALIAECAAAILRVPSPVQSSRTGINLAKETKGSSLDSSRTSSNMPLAGFCFPSPDASEGRRSPGTPQAELLNSMPWGSSMRHSSPTLASSSNRSVSASVSVVRQVSMGSAAAPPANTRQVSMGSAAAPPANTRQVSTGSGAVPPAVAFQPSTGTPSRSSAPVQGTVRAQHSSGMATQQRASAGAIGPGRESKRAGREPKAHSSDRFQPSHASSSFRAFQNITGGRPATPRGSKAANSQFLGPGGSTGKGPTTPTSTGKGAVMSQANRGRFFPATILPLGTPAAAPATTTLPVSHLSPKLNYRMAPAPSSDEESSPPPATENRGSPPDKRSKKTKGPIVTL